MVEKCNPKHPDKIADRIAGAIVDLVYKKSKKENPRVAVEVLIGHGKCHIIAESSIRLYKKEIKEIVNRIAGDVVVDFKCVAQDIHLASNQNKEIRCGDNGIFKGVPLTEEEKELSKIAREIYKYYGSDGKYILDKDKLIICQSNANKNDICAFIENETRFKNAIINPLGDWTGGINVDSGCTNRKLGSDMAQSITGGGLCLSSDSEYLADDYKWHKLSDYNGGKVAQWEDGKLVFVNPIKYICNKNDSLIHIHNKNKLSMCLTPYHQVLIKTSKGNLIKKPAEEIATKLYHKIGNSGSIIHNFTYQKPNYVSSYKDDNEYRLQVAFCADGTILENQNKWNGRIRVKKQEKKDRLRKLLSNKNYIETKDGEYSIFWYNFTKQNKSLYECFKNESWDILKDEIFYWDGDKNKKVFRTTKKEEADFVQLVLQSFGNVVGIDIDDRVGKSQIIQHKSYMRKSINYTVKIYKSNLTQLRKSRNSSIKVEYLNGKHNSYCFEVPSHNLIIRHNNKIFITGNCGKDLSKADVSVNIYAFLKAQETGKVVELCCAIGDNTIDGKPYSEIVEIARNYINKIGGFEKFAEWGLF